MKYNRNFNVAISSYPLMNEGISVDDPTMSLGLNQSNSLKKTISAYIHIPFCDSICDFCIYCRTITKNNEELMTQYVKALIHEIQLYGASLYLKNQEISSIYLGGGTPTALSDQQLVDILHACKQNLPLSEAVEISVEANPCNATKEKLDILKGLDVSRISAGIQTFEEKQRSILGLMKSREEVLQWIDMASSRNFDSIAIDLMYGLPSQSCKDWEEELKLAVKLPIQHISIYELYLVSGTKLFKRVMSGQLTECKNDLLYEMFCQADELLNKNGYRRQIIPEYYKDKPVRFWDNTFDGQAENIALGVSSYGFLNGITYQNCINIRQYINCIQQNRLPVEAVSSPITQEQILERDIILSLRHGWINKNDFMKKHHIDMNEIFKEVIQRQVNKGLMTETNDELLLTQLGSYFQTDIVIEFMQSIFANKSNLYRKLVMGKHRIPAGSNT